MGMVRTAAVLALLAFGSVLTQEQSRTWGPAEVLCSLDSDEVSESSGIAASSSEVGSFFTHNDSGDSARFFKFLRSGKVVGTYLLEGVEARDWEDMAGAVVGGKPYLYFGDVGDNTEGRKDIVVHRVPEPTSNGVQTIKDFESYTLTYPDGPHNCETIFVTSNGNIWLVTKNVGGISRAYTVSKPAKSGSYVLKFVKNIVVDTAGNGGKYVTGGDVSPDGKHVVLRTYSAALEFDVPGKFEDWVDSKPLTIRTAPEIQGEAICYSKNGKALITTSEFAPCPVSLIPLEGTLGQAGNSRISNLANTTSLNLN